MKKIGLGLLMMMIVFTNFFSVLDVKAEEMAQIFSPYGVAIDVKTGEILYDKNANEKAEPASMTKVLTALLIAENMEDGEKMKVTPESIATECSCYGVEDGEELTKEDALKALMIQSANDVAVVAAQHLAGSTEEFAKMMNARAEEIGVSENTHFVTPNGLGSAEHHVTAYDMALITREAVKNPDVLEAMESKEYTVKSNKKEVTLVRHDKISTLEHSVGGKTGFTSAASNTLAVYYKDGEKEVVTVVMKAQGNQYKDSQAMSTYAFDQIQTKTLYKKNQVIDTVKIGKEEIKLLAKNDFYVSYKKGQEQKYDIKTDLAMEKGYIEKGKKIAVAKIYEGEKIIGEMTLVADKNVVYDKNDEQSLKDVKTEKLSIWWAIAIPWFIYVGYLVYYNVQKRKKINTKN